MNDLLMQIILGCSSIIVTACVGVATKAVLDWLKNKKWLNGATEAVNYADQLFKIGTIDKEERKDSALTFLAKKGLVIPEEIADMLIESVIGGINTALGKTGRKVGDNGNSSS